MTVVRERREPSPPGGGELLVELEDLVVDYVTAERTVRAVDHVSLKIHADRKSVV